MKFDSIIDEAFGNKVLGWTTNPSIGWVADSNMMRFYYGTEEKKVRQILRDGIYAGDDGYVLAAAEPNTALMHATMRMPLKENRMFADVKQNVVMVIDIPRSYLAKKHLVVENDNENRFTNKKLYEGWGKSDVEYYALIDVLIPECIPSKYIKGYMKKNG